MTKCRDLTKSKPAALVHRHCLQKVSLPYLGLHTLNERIIRNLLRCKPPIRIDLRPDVSTLSTRTASLSLSVHCKLKGPVLHRLFLTTASQVDSFPIAQLPSPRSGEASSS